MKITASNLLGEAGLSAMVAGIIFAVVGLIHPPQIVSSVTTGTWTIVHLLTIAMSFFGLLGIAGIYARQVEKAGWMGLAGFLLLSLWFVLVTGFTFFEHLSCRCWPATHRSLRRAFWGSSPGPPARQASEPGNALVATRSRVHPREPAVRHRHVPRRHPVALGGRPAWFGGSVIPSVCAASARTRTASGSAGGVRPGVAGICALV
jgi:hypothetical protein